MNKILTYLKGKKTYITVVAGVAVGIAQALGYHIPIEVDYVLGFLGLGFHRQAVSDASAKTAEDIRILVQAITDEITAK